MKLTQKNTLNKLTYENLLFKTHYYWWPKNKITKPSLIGFDVRPTNTALIWEIFNYNKNRKLYHPLNWYFSSNNNFFATYDYTKSTLFISSLRAFVRSLKNNIFFYSKIVFVSTKSSNYGILKYFALKLRQFYVLGYHPTILVFPRAAKKEIIFYRLQHKYYLPYFPQFAVCIEGRHMPDNKYVKFLTGFYCFGFFANVRYANKLTVNFFYPRSSSLFFFFFSFLMTLINQKKPYLNKHNSNNLPSSLINKVNNSRVRFFKNIKHTNFNSRFYIESFKNVDLNSTVRGLLNKNRVISRFDTRGLKKQRFFKYERSLRTFWYHNYSRAFKKV